MAEQVTVRMLVGSKTPYGGDNPVTQIGMMCIPDLEANLEVQGPPARGHFTIFLKDENVMGVELNTAYDVTLTPVE